MPEFRLFEEGTVPECSTPEWYADRERAPHVDEPMHRERLELAAQFVKDAAHRMSAHSVVDLGAGDGGLLTLLPPTLKAWGYDLQFSNVEGAFERGVNVQIANVLDDPIDWGEIAVATEMIEHLIDPHAFVRFVKDNAKVCVASSPWTETDAAHYDFHLWAWDMYGYRKLFEDAGWYVWAHEKAGMFQVLMAVNVHAIRKTAA